MASNLLIKPDNDREQNLDMDTGILQNVIHEKLSETSWSTALNFMHSLRMNPFACEDYEDIPGISVMCKGYDK